MYYATRSDRSAIVGASLTPSAEAFAKLAQAGFKQDESADTIYIRSQRGDLAAVYDRSRLAAYFAQQQRVNTENCVTVTI